MRWMKDVVGGLEARAGLGRDVWVEEEQEAGFAIEARDGEGDFLVVAEG